MHAIFLHAGNVLYLIAFLVRDILWLRLMTIIASIALMAYYLSCPEGPLWMPMAWNSIFIAINIVQAVILYLERSPVYLKEHDLRIYRSLFQSLTPREFVKLIRLSQARRAELGERMLEQGAEVDRLILITNGRASVELSGRPIAQLAPLQFLGEMAFLTQQPASAQVVAAEPTDYLEWPFGTLRRLLQSSGDLDAKIHRILGADLISKLRSRAISSDHPSFSASQ